MNISDVKKAYWRAREGLSAEAARLRAVYWRGNNPIPTVGVTGSIGKTTTSRLIAHIFAESGKTVALSTTQGAWIGSDKITSGDCSRGDVAKRLYLDPRSQAGVFELARGSLIERGVVLDFVDAGIALNVYDNHLGLQGVETREELALVKRKVVEKARLLAVVNADDPLCLAMRDATKAPLVCLVSMGSTNPYLRSHRKDGGMVAHVEGSGETSELTVQHKGRRCLSLAVSEIPVTWSGRFRPGISNALFAMAVSLGLGVEAEVVSRALGMFQSDHDGNPGRMNFIEDLPYQLCITWVDGPQAMKETAVFIEGLKITGKKYAMLAAMGNRPDDFIKAQGQAAGAMFSEYICTDWEDLRGRPPLETAGLLADGVRDSGVPQDRIHIAHSHEAALDTALARPDQDDFLLIVTYSGEKAWERAMALRATARSSV
jgi:cyanophycin synthetase